MVTDQQANRLIKLMKEEQTKGATEDKARKVMNDWEF